MKKLIAKNVHQSYFVVMACFGVIMGVIIALILRVNFFISQIWIAFAVSLMFFIYLKPKLTFVAFALIAGMVLGFFRVGEELKSEDYVQQLLDKDVVVMGEVDGDPETDEKGTKIKLKKLQFGENEKHEASGSIFITVRQNEEIKRADTIKIDGKLMEGFGTYIGYMYKPKILQISRPEPGSLVLKVRNWFAERIFKLIPNSEANLGLSYLLGMRTGLEKNLAENLRTVGLVHIITASGAHLSILVRSVRKVLGRLSRFMGFLFSVIAILFFMTMVGFTPSIMRAGIMAILGLAAWYVGREFGAWRMILIVAAGTLLYNPMYVINLGWLLSFASYFGIMILGPKIEKFFYGDREPKFIASIIMTTLAATIMTLPITLYFFGMVSLISVIANLLILPTLPYVMGLVFLTGAVAGLPFIEVIVAFLTTKLLDFHILVVEFFGAQKSFVVNIEPYQPRVFFIYILVLVPLAVGFLIKISSHKNNMIKLGKEIY